MVTTEQLPRLKFTICFIIHGNRVLLLRRRFSPWAGMLNGIGGKLEQDETPEEGMLREIKEEVGLSGITVRFGGVVTWRFKGVPGKESDGMYVYLAVLPDELDPASITGETEEGTLEWWPLDIVFNTAPRQDVPLVTNIRHFLRPMLNNAPPAEYRLWYEERELRSVEVRPFGSTDR